MDLLSDIGLGVLLGVDCPVDEIFEEDGQPVWIQSDCEAESISFFMEFRLLVCYVHFRFVTNYISYKNSIYIV